MIWLWINIGTLTLWIWLIGRSAAVVGSRDRQPLLLTFASMVGLSHILRLTSAIPPTWFTPLQEGTTLDSLRNIGTVNAHGGANWHILLSLWTGGHSHAEAVMAANVALTTTCALFTGWVGFRLTGSATAGLVATLWCGLNPVTQQLRFSEQPTPLLSVLLLASIPPWLTWRDQAQPTRIRRVGLVTLVGLGLMITGVRVEVAGFLWTALTLGVIIDIFPVLIARSAQRVEDLLSRLTLRVRQLTLRRKLFGLFMIVAIAIMGVPRPLSYVLGVSGQIAWLVDAFHPLDFRWLQIPGILAGLAPLAGALFMGAGLLLGLRHPFRTGGLSVSLIFLFLVWTSASHGCLFEMIRYLGPTVPIFGLIGLQGWMSMRDQMTRSQRALAGWAFLIPPWTGFASLTIPWPGDLQALPWPGLLDRDVQREARLVLETRAAYPDCVILARTARWSDIPPVPDHEPNLIDPVTLGDGVFFWTDPGRDLDIVFYQPPHLRQPTPPKWPHILTTSPCAVYIRSLGCNTTGGPLCDDEIGGAAPVRSLQFKNFPYNHPVHPQPNVPDVTLSVHVIDPVLASQRIRLTPP